jgi:hypothetical protein
MSEATTLREVRGFHFDGFFWGKPQPFWFSRTKLFGNFPGFAYNRLCDFITSRGIPHSDVTLYNKYLLIPFMMPSTIIADVEKIEDLPRSLLSGRRKSEAPAAKD